jgi:uncharacterized membrane protein YbhN (UPF0104 family)
VKHVDVTPQQGPSTEPERRPEPEKRHLHIRIFSSASDAARARRPTDGAAFIFSTIGVLLCLVPAPDPTQLDTSISNLVQDLPGLFGGVWEISFNLLILWPLVLLLVTLIARGRKRVFGDMLLALFVGLVYTGLASTAIGMDVSTELRSIADTGPSSAYLAVRLALATALLATVSPHMSEPLRKLGRWVIFLGALAGIALGIVGAVATLVGFLLGIAAAATVHLIFGSPGGRLTLEEVSRLLGELGVEALGLRAAPLEPRGVAIVLASTPEGRPLLIKLFGRDARGGRLIASTWSSFRRRGETPQLSSGWQQVQHEAFVSLLAERGGVPVMSVVAAGTAVDGDALLVLDANARTLASLAAEDVEDRVIEQFWQAFERLEGLGIAMGRVDGYGLFVRTDGEAAVGEFADASVAADRGALLADKAQLLVATALSVGRHRAVQIAARTIGNEALEEALPYVQHAVLDPTVWHAVKEREWDLEELRVLAEQETGTAPPKLEQLRRVTWASILKLALIGLVAYAIFTAFSHIGLEAIIDEFQSASKGWLIPALVMTPFVQLPQAVSTLGATLRPLRYWPVLMLQYGIQFIALAVPSSAARVALEIRFFERVAVPAAGAVTIGMIDSLSTFFIQILLLIVIALSGLVSLDTSGDGSSNTGSSSHSSIDWETVAIVIGLLAIAFLVALLVPRFRNMMKLFIAGLRQKTAEGREALKVLRNPMKLLFLFGGNLIVQFLMAIILGLCLGAFGHSATLAELIFVNTFVTLFAGFMPVPGGVGVAEAGYTAGLIAIGVPEAAATSTALLFRIITFYLPPLWGSFAMRWMRENRYL